MDAAVTSSNKFGFKLFLTERKENKDENVFFSPLSITLALSMLYAGTKENTKKQIEEILNIKDDDQSIHQEFRALSAALRSTDVRATLNIANLIAVDANFTILPEYSKELTSNYSVDAKKFDFRAESEKARLEINGLIESATQKKISDLFPSGSIDIDTKLILANAIYFKGNWNMPFDKDITTRKPFYTIKNEEKMVDMMFRMDDYKYCFMKELKVSFLEIPYDGERFSMIVLLPEEKNGLPSIESSITDDHIDRGTKMMRMRDDVNVFLPKFKLEKSLPLKDRLMQLGMIDAFNKNADLSGISGERNLYVSDALHKAFVEVNEEGTEAAAATGLRLTFMCYRPPLDFVVDRPFMFIIREVKTGLILFIGSVYDLV